MALQEELETAGLAVPRVADLELDKEMLHVLLREGRVTRISEDFVYLPDQVAQVPKDCPTCLKHSPSPSSGTPSDSRGSTQCRFLNTSMGRASPLATETLALSVNEV